MMHDDTLFPDTKATLRWLNTPPKQEKLDALVYGLKKQFFESKKDLSNSLILRDSELI